MLAGRRPRHLLSTPRTDHASGAISQWPGPAHRDLHIHTISRTVLFPRTSPACQTFVPSRPSPSRTTTAGRRAHRPGPRRRQSASRSCRPLELPRKGGERSARAGYVWAGQAPSSRLEACGSEIGGPRKCPKINELGVLGDRHLVTISPSGGMTRAATASKDWWAACISPWRYRRSSSGTVKEAFDRIHREGRPGFVKKRASPPEQRFRSS